MKSILEIVGIGVLFMGLGILAFGVFGSSIWPNWMIGVHFMWTCLTGLIGLIIGLVAVAVAVWLPGKSLFEPQTT